MTDLAATVVDRALELKAADRAKVAEQILQSLEALNPAVETAWAVEADARVEGFARGDIEAIPAEEVFAKYAPDAGQVS